MVLIIDLLSNQGRLITGGGTSVSWPYPSIHEFKTQEDVDLAFKIIRDAKLRIVSAPYKIINMPFLTDEQRKFRGRSQVIEFDDAGGSYMLVSWLSDWFNESCRLSCKRYDEDLSPMDGWEKYGDEICAENPDATPQKLNDLFYEKYKGCNTFRPTMARGMIRATCAASYLDISAGWGDRLLGAMAAGVRYVGVDPNPCVHEGYAKMIETFRPNPAPTLIIAPFEVAELPDEKFDLVFTSPPYFDLEVYASDSAQSIEKFRGAEAWLRGFLIPSLEKAYSVLNPGGYMIININITRGGFDYVTEMISAVNAFPDVDYQGILPYGVKTHYGHKSPQPMFVWQKKAELSIERLAECHIDSLLNITTDIEVMKDIASGKTWERNRLEELVKYSDTESAEITYAHWVIKYGTRVIGYIGLYPLEDDLQFRIFIGTFEQGRGYGKKAVRLVIDQYKGKKKLYWQVHMDNMRSIKMARDLGFVDVDGVFRVGKTPVVRLVLKK